MSTRSWFSSICPLKAILLRAKEPLIQNSISRILLLKISIPSSPDFWNYLKYSTNCQQQNISNLSIYNHLHLLPIPNWGNSPNSNSTIPRFSHVIADGFRARIIAEEYSEYWNGESRPKTFQPPLPFEHGLPTWVTFVTNSYKTHHHFPSLGLYSRFWWGW